MIRLNKNNFCTLCTNGREVLAELGVDEQDLPEKKFPMGYEYDVLHLSYSCNLRDNDTDRFTLVKDLERPGTYTAIDDGLLEVVLHLNRIGITTCFCCEGHIQKKKRNEKESGNLLFLPPRRARKDLNEALRFLAENGFELENRPFLGTDRINISWSFSSPEEKAGLLKTLNSTLLKLKIKQTK